MTRSAGIRSGRIRALLKWLAWIAAGTLGLVLCIYALVVAINWKDQAPSPAAQRFAAAYRDRPAVADADNAFIHVTGFMAPPDEDPRTAGVERLAWQRQFAGTEQEVQGEDPVPEETQYRSRRTPEIQAVVEACRSASSGCAAVLEGDEAVLQGWLDSEAWLLARYRDLLRHEGWLETVPHDERVPLPSYSGVMDGQKLLLVEAALMARGGNAAGVRKLLGEDSRFWRMVLASADILITKMIATAALNRNLEVGNLVLRQLPAGISEQAIPAEWTLPLTDPELSLRRTYVGEWIFSDGIVRRQLREAGNEDGLAGRILARLVKPLYRPQDTRNQQAEFFERLLAAQDVPLEQYPDVIDRLEGSPLGENRWSAHLYNPIGDLMLSISLPSFLSYSARVTDIEGVRLAALQATRLRSRKVGPQDVAAELAGSEIRNPYTSEVLGWDPDARAIVFQGLEKSERGRHLLIY